MQQLTMPSRQPEWITNLESIFLFVDDSEGRRRGLRELQVEAPFYLFNVRVSFRSMASHMARTEARWPVSVLSRQPKRS